jgi:2,4-dienoyl-CoA reductase-like NADH-dependent reductase (Old Yellow Enzyme family)
LEKKVSIYGGEGSFPVPNEGIKESIAQIIERFVNSTVLAEEAGFDGVEIDGASGLFTGSILNRLYESEKG